MGWALVGPPWALVGQALVGSTEPLSPCRQGPCGPSGHLWEGPLWAPWALMGCTLVNQRLGSMANALNLLVTLEWHKAIRIYMYTYIYVCIYIYAYFLTELCS